MLSFVISGLFLKHNIQQTINNQPLTFTFFILALSLHRFEINSYETAATYQGPKKVEEGNRVAIHSRKLLTDALGRTGG
jgi:hypothetical protein